MKLEDALLWVENECQNQNNNDNDINENQELCPITKQPIVNKITLFCGHSFEYMALFKETQNYRKFHKCPYCRRVFNNYIPYYDLEELRESGENDYIGRYFKNEYLTCSHVFKSGKNKGKCCGKVAHKFGDHILCTTHIRNLKKQKIKKDKM
jgi:hypothetical protein